MLTVVSHTSSEFQSFYGGFVWVEDGRVVGNVTLQRSDPYGQRWQIANVAVYPANRGRGIARALMETALGYIEEQGGSWAVLQVRADNPTARGLYERLGFEAITTTTEQRLARVPTSAPSPAPLPGLHPRPRSDWQQEYNLALAATPPLAQWWQPVRAETFRPTLEARFSEKLAVLAGERRIIREGVYAGSRLLAALTIRAARWAGHHRLTLIVHPEHRGRCEMDLVGHAVNLLVDYPRRPVSVTHPAEHEAALDALKAHGFYTVRSLVTMRRWMHGSKTPGERRPSANIS
jgi:N-acetylglutamate synthase-like GNAT family acetyltransferase